VNGWGKELLKIVAATALALAISYLLLTGEIRLILAEQATQREAIQAVRATVRELSTTDRRLALLEADRQATTDRFSLISQRVFAINSRVDGLGTRLEAIDVKGLQAQLDEQRRAQARMDGVLFQRFRPPPE
jgi:hypothetical protein